MTGSWAQQLVPVGRPKGRSKRQIKNGRSKEKIDPTGRSKKKVEVEAKDRPEEKVQVGAKQVAPSGKHQVGSRSHYIL